MEEIQIDYTMGTATFYINMLAETNKTTYAGLFKVKCILSPLEYIQADSLNRDLLGKTNPQLASGYISRLAYAISQVKYRVMESPDWFKNASSGMIGGNIDDGILMHVFDKCVESELSYRDGIEDRYKKTTEKVRDAVDNNKISLEEEQEEQED